jgi:flagellar basal-body rod protein FlgG
VNVQIGQLQLATFINPTGLQSIGENLYLETDASGPPNLLQPGLDGAGVILQKYVETSNVNVAEELVKMIITQRAYEMNSKSIQTEDEMLASLTRL